MTTVTLQHRKRTLVNTDPQRRCYDGVHFSSELRWTEWSDLETGIPAERAEDRLEFWRSLNKIAVDGRGEGARSEFRITKRKKWHDR